MITAYKPSLLNLNIIDTTQKIGRASTVVGKSIYNSVKNATAEDVKEFTLRAGTNIAAGALTKAFVGAALAGAAPTVVTVGATALAVGAVSTKITHWRDCKKAIANNEEPPKFNWENYGLKGLFSSAMVGFGAFFSEQILNLFTPSGASAETLPQIESDTVIEQAPIAAEEIELSTVAPHTEVAEEITEIVPQEIQTLAPEVLTIEADTPKAEFVPATELAAPVVPEVNVQTEVEVAAPPAFEAVAPIIAEPVELLTPDVLEPVNVQTVAPAAIAVEEIAIDALDVPKAELQQVDIGQADAPAKLIVPEIPEFTVPDEVPYIVQSVEVEAAQPVVPEVIEPIAPTPVEELQALELGDKAEFALEAHIDGNAQGTADLGYFYFHGEQGVPQDYERAVEFYREAAEQDNSYALRDLFYVENEAEKVLGYSVPEIVEEPKDAVVSEVNADVAEISEEIVPLSPVEELQAMEIGSKAENALDAHINGNAQGTADLGYFYFHGEQGMPQDYEKAVHFYREAAAEGNRFALRDLAYIENQAEKALGYPVPDEIINEAIVAAEDVAPDMPLTSIEELQAMEIGSKAENALEAHIDGNAQGTADLGYFYFHGHQGMPQDLGKAVEFYRQAALDGNGYAIRDLAFVEGEAIKAGVELSEFDLPEHLYDKSAPAIHNTSGSGSPSVRSGLRASCVGDLQAVSGSKPQLQFDCNVRGNHAYIYPGEHVSVRLPGGASHVFNLDAGVTRQPVNDFFKIQCCPRPQASMLWIKF